MQTTQTEIMKIGPADGPEFTTAEIADNLSQHADLVAQQFTNPVMLNMQLVSNNRHESKPTYHYRLLWSHD